MNSEFLVILKRCQAGERVATPDGITKKLLITAFSSFAVPRRSAREPKVRQKSRQKSAKSCGGWTATAERGIIYIDRMGEGAGSKAQPPQPQRIKLAKTRNGEHPRRHRIPRSPADRRKAGEQDEPKQKTF